MISEYYSLKGKLETANNEIKQYKDTVHNLDIRVLDLMQDLANKEVELKQESTGTFLILNETATIARVTVGDEWRVRNYYADDISKTAQLAVLKELLNFTPKDFSEQIINGVYAQYCSEYYFKNNLLNIKRKENLPVLMLDGKRYAIDIERCTLVSESIEPNTNEVWFIENDQEGTNTMAWKQLIRAFNEAANKLAKQIAEEQEAEE